MARHNIKFVRIKHSFTSVVWAADILSKNVVTKFSIPMFCNTGPLYIFSDNNWAPALFLNIVHYELTNLSSKCVKIATTRGQLTKHQNPHFHRSYFHFLPLIDAINVMHCGACMTKPRVVLWRDHFHEALRRTLGSVAGTVQQQQAYHCAKNTVAGTVQW